MYGIAANSDPRKRADADIGPRNSCTNSICTQNVPAILQWRGHFY